ncbi:MAG TPA: hypothetical protein VIX14_13610 [Terriglobales bacterium]
MKFPIRIIFSAALFAVVLTCVVSATAGDRYDTRGNILIANQFNNWVLEIDPRTPRDQRVVRRRFLDRRPGFRSRSQ